MCTYKEIDTVHKWLFEKGEKVTINGKSLISNISNEDFFDAIKELVYLGFATQNFYLTGERDVELTESGREMFLAVRRAS